MILGFVKFLILLVSSVIVVTEKEVKLFKKMLGGESSNYFFQTPTVENPYWFDLNAPSHPKLPGIDRKFTWNP